MVISFQILKMDSVSSPRVTQGLRENEDSKEAWENRLNRKRLCVNKYHCMVTNSCKTCAFFDVPVRPVTNLIPKITFSFVFI